MVGCCDARAMKMLNVNVATVQFSLCPYVFFLIYVGSCSSRVTQVHNPLTHYPTQIDQVQANPTQLDPTAGSTQPGFI